MPLSWLASSWQEPHQEAEVRIEDGVDAPGAVAVVILPWRRCRRRCSRPGKPSHTSAWLDDAAHLVREALRGVLAEGAAAGGLTGAGAGGAAAPDEAAARAPRAAARAVDRGAEGIDLVLPTPATWLQATEPSSRATAAQEPAHRIISRSLIVVSRGGDPLRFPRYAALIGRQAVAPIGSDLPVPPLSVQGRRARLALGVLGLDGLALVVDLLPRASAISTLARPP